MPDENITPDAVALLRETARKDLYVFTKGVLGFGWLVPHVHMHVCRLLELYDGWNDSLAHPRKVYEDVLHDKHIRPKLSDEQISRLLTKGIKTLGFVLPRSWLKTTLCSISYPIWRAIRNPNVRSLLAQNTFKNACAKNKVIMASFEKSQLLQVLFPELQPTPRCTWSAESLCLNRKAVCAEGTFEAAGTRTQVTSRHYDIISEDDTVAPDKDELGEDFLFPSKDDIAQAIGWHRLVPPLFVDPTTAQNLIVATRWYVDDLISHVQSHEPGFIWYMRACREDTEGNPDEKGELQYPERFSAEVLADLEHRLGPYLYSCLYLNRPLHSKDMVFKPEWVKYADTWPRSLVCFTTVDPAGIAENQGSDSDFNVVLTTGKDLVTGRIYVLEYFHQRCSPGDVIQAMFDQVKRWHPVKVKIETVAYQSTLAYWTRERMREEGFYFNIESCPHPKGAKPIRICSLQPLFSNGMIILRPHMQELVTELLSFPRGAHDDLLDALAAQMEMWQVTASVSAVPGKTFEDDPLSVDAAIASLREHQRIRSSLFPSGGLVTDVCDVREPLVMN